MSLLDSLMFGRVPKNGAHPFVLQVSKLIVQNGGTVVLAETDELIGAEEYVVSNAANLETAKARPP